MENHERTPSPPHGLLQTTLTHDGSESQDNLVSSLSSDMEASRNPRTTSNHSHASDGSPLLVAQTASVHLNNENIELAELETLTRLPGIPSQGSYSFPSSHSHTSAVQFSTYETAKSWIGEFLYLITAVSVLVAIVAILSRYNGREQPLWPYGDVLDLSALIALLATVLRSMLAGIIESSTLLSWAINK